MFASFLLQGIVCLFVVCYMLLVAYDASCVLCCLLFVVCPLLSVCFDMCSSLVLGVCYVLIACRS